MGVLTLLCFLEFRKYISFVKGAPGRGKRGGTGRDTWIARWRNSEAKSLHNKMYYFFTDVPPWAILLFRFPTNPHPNLNFFVLSILHKFSAPLSKKYKKLPTLIISLMIIYDLLRAHMKSIFLLVIWSCVDVMTCPAIRTQKTNNSI